ncbi:hypothetical protein TRIP_E190023 [uncultured Spirochaetota bacterium]|nr:hypothetical protein TRIP_E190023 [uncultured Spirochaetota bacterium]
MALDHGPGPKDAPFPAAFRIERSVEFKDILRQLYRTVKKSCIEGPKRARAERN